MLDKSLSHWNMVFLGSQVHGCQPILRLCRGITLTIQQKGCNLSVALLCNHVNRRESILKGQDAINANILKSGIKQKKIIVPLTLKIEQ